MTHYPSPDMEGRGARNSATTLVKKKSLFFTFVHYMTISQRITEGWFEQGRRRDTKALGILRGDLKGINGRGGGEARRQVLKIHRCL